MHLLPVQTPVIREGDDVAAVIAQHADLHSGDILVVSAKPVAVAEGATIDLSSVRVTDEARTRAKQYGRDPAFQQAVMDEAQRLNGRIISEDSRATLTELRPEGLPAGTIMVAGAGLDRSNTKDGTAVGWPRDPVASVRTLRQMLRSMLRNNDSAVLPHGEANFGIILSDSSLRPRRVGLTAFALTVSGIDPLRSEIGTPDLHGRRLQVTCEATADQLATAANTLMGNAAQSIPAVIVRGSGIPLSDNEGWVPGIEPEDDLFQGQI